MPRHGKYLVLIPDAIYAPVTTGLLICAVGLLGLWFDRPWLFASLGPTAFQLAEYPEQKSSRIYNVIIGHLAGLSMGFAAVAIMNTWGAPSVLATHHLTRSRVFTSGIAIVMTSIVIIILRASHPPAGATALLVALGSFSTLSDAATVIEAVIVIAVLGEGVRYLRLYGMHNYTEEPLHSPETN